MKLILTLQHGSKTGEHELELRFPQDGSKAGRTLTYVLDQQTGKADCARITPGVYSILMGGRSYEARIATPTSEAAANPSQRIVTVGARHFRVVVHDPRRRRPASTPVTAGGAKEVLAPMPGKIIKVLVARDQEVTQGAGLLVIEAMKMQNELRAPRAGRVEEIYVVEGIGVESGARLVRLV